MMSAILPRSIVSIFGVVSVREKRQSYEDELRQVYPINSNTLEAPDGYKD